MHGAGSEQSPSSAAIDCSRAATHALAIALLWAGCGAPAAPVDAEITLDGGRVDAGLRALDAGTADAGGGDRRLEDGGTEDGSVDDAGLDPRRCVRLEPVAPFLGGAHGLAQRSDGSLLIADTFASLGRAAVVELTAPYTGAPSPTGIRGPRPAGLLLEPGGSLLVADPAAGVARWDATLTAQTPISSLAAWNVAARDETLYVVTFDGGLYRLDDAEPTAIVRGLESPFDLAVDPSGCIWVSEQGPSGDMGGGVRCFDASGAVSRTLEYDFVNPEGLAVDRDGALWIAETGRGELLRVPPGALAVQVVATDLELPVVLIVSPTDDGVLLGTVGRTAEVLHARWTCAAP